MKRRKKRKQKKKHKMSRPIRHPAREEGYACGCSAAPYTPNRKRLFQVCVVACVVCDSCPHACETLLVAFFSFSILLLFVVSPYEENI